MHYIPLVLLPKSLNEVAFFDICKLMKNIRTII